MFCPWAPCQIRKIAGCACAGNAGNVFPPPRVSNPGMHHGTCVTHVPWCKSRSITSGFLWIHRREKSSRHSRHMRNPQFYVSGKRPMPRQLWTYCSERHLTYYKSRISLHWFDCALGFENEWQTPFVCFFRTVMVFWWYNDIFSIMK